MVNIISYSEARDIMLSKESDDSIEETLYLHSIPGVMESIREGAKAPIEECIREEDLPEDLAWLKSK